MASDGTQGDKKSGYCGIAISADGRFVAFRSLPSTLVPDDTNGRDDIFVRERDITLNVTASGSGTGTVELSPSGGAYDEAARVTLTAFASAGSFFDHWEGDLTGSANLHGETSVSDFVGQWVVEGKEMKFRYGILPTATRSLLALARKSVSLGSITLALAP